MKDKLKCLGGVLTVLAGSGLMMFASIPKLWFGVLVGMVMMIVGFVVTLKGIVH
jgi:hypothetical protein